MKAIYVKPEMTVSVLEMETYMAVVSGEFTGGSDSKRRERWEEGTDLWGNDCWNRVE